MVNPQRVYSKRAGAPAAPRGAVYVGRPTRWGNPFRVGVDGDQGECVRLYANALADHWATASLVGIPELHEIREELGGRPLVCWCAPKACHADVLALVAACETDEQAVDALEARWPSRWTKHTA